MSLWRSATATAATTRGGPEHDHLRDDDVRPVLGLAVLLGLGVLDPSFGVEAVTLLHPLLDDIDQASEERQPVPFGLFLLLPRSVLPLTVGGERQFRNAIAGSGGSNLGLAPDVTDEHDLVERPAHFRVLLGVRAECDPARGPGGAQGIKGRNGTLWSGGGAITAVLGFRNPRRPMAPSNARPKLPSKAMTDLQYIRVEWDDDLAIVVIDRPDKLNALNAEVVQELGDVFRDLRQDDAVRGVVLTGAGDKAFVAGADIGELAQMSPLSGVEVSRDGQRIFSEIERFPKPVLAAVGGYALGGGCELALACHLRVASDNARFGLPEVGLGIIPGYGGTLRLSRLVGLGRAIELTLTGAMLDAEKAERIGLVSAVYPQEELLDRAKGFIRTITKNGPVAVRMALDSIYLALDAAPADAQKFESALFGLLASTGDMKEGMTAFLEKRKPAFKGE